MAAAICVAVASIGSGFESQAHSQNWIWIDGSATIPSYVSGSAGVCGMPGLAGTANVPGGRSYASSWIDSAGHLWLFGGYGYDCSGTAGSLNDLWEFDPQTEQWTWMGGANMVGGRGGAAGLYGAPGVSAAGNAPGGRDSASRWTDSEGHFWLFGGIGFDANGWFGNLNDLWEFDPSTQEWMWVAGSQVLGSPEGQPGFYGSAGAPSATAAPGGRAGASAWTDLSGDLWLFGGSGQDANGTMGELNDLWTFNRGTRQWTWISGASTLPPGAGGQAGVYGALGEPAPGNLPGGRDRASAWADSGGNLWLLGGYGYDSTGKAGLLNDLWKFNPSTAEWTWMGGSRTVGAEGGAAGVYGTRGVAGTETAPGSREGASAWMDASGNLWLFAGDGMDSAGHSAVLNDLWQFVPSSHEWMWVGGSSIVPANSGQAGQYGPVEYSPTTEAPGGRTGSTVAVDQEGNLWLSGGYGMDAGQKDGELNDVWEFAGSISGEGSSAAVGYSLSATSVALAAGVSGTSTMTVTASGGYRGTITLTCAVSSTPAGAVDTPTCTVAQAVTLTPAMEAATAVIAVNTSAAEASPLPNKQDAAPRGPAAAAAFGIVLCVSLGRRRIRVLSLVLLCSAALCGGVTGCGTTVVPGGRAVGQAGGTSPGVYICTVTGVGNDAAATRAATSFSVTVE